MRTRFILALALVACKQPVEAACEVECASNASPFAFDIDEAAIRATSDHAGVTSLVPLGDVDGDGLADVGIHATSGGAVLTAAAWLAGDDAVGLGGDRLAPAGDLNGDGRMDLAIIDAHDVRIHTEIASTPASVLEGVPDASFVAARGGADFDRDGVDDLLLAYREENGDRDKQIVRMLSGADYAAGVIDVEVTSEGFGVVLDGEAPPTLSILGDFDEDGRPDIATGGPRNFAGVHTASRWGSGLFGGLADQEVHVHDCHPDGCDAVVATEAVGDTEHDGLADLLLTSTDGGVWVIPGIDLANDVYQTQLVGGEQVHGRELVNAIDARPAGDPTGEGASDLLVTLDDGTTVLLDGFAIDGDAVTVPTDFDAEYEAGEDASVLGVLHFDVVDAVGVGDVDGDGIDDLAVVEGDRIHLIGSAPAE